MCLVSSPGIPAVGERYLGEAAEFARGETAPAAEG